MYHPWRELRALEHVSLHFVTDLPRGVDGLTDGHATIWMRKGMAQVQRRCVLTHELVHIDREHRGHQDDEAEASVRLEVAHLLIPDVHHLAATLAWADDMYEAAGELWVTPEVLTVRMEDLHPAEKAIIRQAVRG